jgi:arylsulfatase A-like enzyme
MARRAHAASGALWGALGGVAAGAVDFALAHERAAAFLPSGQARLLLFLCALYGAAAATCGLILALAADALGWATDFGALFDEDREGARWAAYGVAILAASFGVGVFAREMTLFALVKFHHRVLIAALVGASTAGVAILAAAAVLMVAAVLSPLLRFGRRARPRLAAPLAVAVAGWIAGLVAAAGGVTLLLLSLQQRGRMPAPLKALNAGLWSPVIVVGSLVVMHLAARAIGRRLNAAWLRTPFGALVVGAAMLLVPMGVGAAAQWSTVRQLDGRPWLALVVAAAALIPASRRKLPELRPLARALMAVGLPAALLCVALWAGRSDRVRKSAAAFTGATAPLVAVIHAATDLDRDGYSSVLGGGDCNDFDRSVHPGAFDWPDDGIDQDCNGHEATLTPPAPRAWAEVPASVPRDLNVLMLTIDALRADHVGAYGYARATTPNLDALAKESILFENGWAHAPSTRYSVPAILTGRYPSTIAVGNAHWPPNVLPENRLISEILKEQGYRTSAFLSYYYFERGWGLDQGFDDYDIHLQTLHSMGGDPAATHGSSARQLADLDVQYLADHKNDKFFLWSHYYDTHFMFERHAEPETHFGNSELDLYDGEIRYTDIQLGRVFDALKQAGLWDKTIILVTADHGDGFGEHGIPKNQRHGYHLYRTETKVPFIIRVPGLQPRVVTTPAAHIDLIPTLLNALRSPAGVEPQLLGDSLLGEMTGAVPDHDRRIFQEVWFEGPTSLKAVVDRGWHLIRNLVPDDTTELYDLVHDADENHDLSGQGEPAEREMMAALGGWMDQIALPPDFKRRVEGNLSQKPIASQQKLGDVLGGWLAIDGADVVTPSAKPGSEAEVDLILHGLGNIPEGWILYTHFNGARGHSLNADHAPLQGAFPLERMHDGVWLRDKIQVKLPPDWPPGPVSVEVGLWRRGQRAPARGAHSANGGVHVATFTVTP